MDKGWVEMKVQIWHLHCRILCQMVVDQTFEGSAWLGGKKGQLGRPSTSTGGLRRQDHAKMNARILGHAMAMQRRNDQKVISHIRVKAQRKWNHLVVVTKQCPPFPKPALVKLALEQLLNVLGFNA
jgi:hypothetical protein